MECSISSRKAYNCTSCGEIGRRKSENIKPYAGIRQDSDPFLAIWDTRKTDKLSLFSLFRSGRF
ncbi:MAG: hypothetical protein DBX45_08380 [Oscillospiraceae bacterium]|nr:MAG: hypothetical protein DBX45_08380 [Oscillospiraceae bacterium]